MREHFVFLEGHKCRRVHGYTWDVALDVEVAHGDDPHGYVFDHAVLRRVAWDVIGQLDHHLLNEIEGLERGIAEDVLSWLVVALAEAINGGLAQLTRRRAPRRALEGLDPGRVGPGGAANTTSRVRPTRGAWPLATSTGLGPGSPRSRSRDPAAASACSTGSGSSSSIFLMSIRLRQGQAAQASPHDDRGRHLADPEARQVLGRPLSSVSW